VAPSETDPVQRRVAIALVALVLALFIVECVALALGAIVLAVACAAVFVVAWFCLRSWSRRRDGAGGLRGGRR
jgi:hypothetical protein